MASGKDEQVTAQTMIAAGPAHTFLAHVTVRNSLTSKKSNSDEAHNRAKAAVQAAQVNPWRCSTASAPPGGGNT